MTTLTLKPRFVSVAEAAEYAGMSQHTLRQRLVDPDHPIVGVKDNRRVLVDVSSLDGYLDGLRRLA